jgi:hypothetical protein
VNPYVHVAKLLYNGSLLIMDAAESETTAYFSFELEGNVELISSR